jgi:lambda repressor-like predicted transcriptional regulator
MTFRKDWPTPDDNSSRHPDHRRPTPQPLPSILDLGRHAGTATLRGDDIGDQPETGWANGLMTLHYDQAEALRDLMLTFQAQTLGDAAAQLWAAFRAAEELEAGLPPEECVTAIKRALISALPLVAKAAGIDLAEIGAERIADLAEHEFPAGAD